MTYTLAFRVTREVWDALERGEKMVEYRDTTFFWDARMKNARRAIGQGREALFLGPPKEKGGLWRKARYNVKGVVPLFLKYVPERWRGYLTTPEVWAVELGARI